MAECDQVKLLLGPFDDGELEPHEMEDVALHVVGCPACKAALADYRSLGVTLRDCTPQPALDGFTAAVLKRIDEIPQPIWKRWRYYVEALSQSFGGTASLFAAGALAALVTAWLVAPYADRLLHRSSNVVQVAAENGDDLSATEPAANATQIASDQSQTSMITLSNDPDTTVIWLPNQP
jgi:anti-sigma factor RsiW